VLNVLRRYAYLEAGVQTDRQWHLAIGVAIGCAFKLMARYADMRHVRYDDEGFRVHDMYIRIFVSERKTHVYGGQSGSFGVFDALLLGKEFSVVASSCLTSTRLGAYTLIAPWSTTATCFTYDTRW
jgi:hypothetical protein